MNADRNEQVLAAWRKLLSSPEISMGAEEQYDELLKLADEYKRAGVIDVDDWRGLVEEATAFYAHSVKGLEGGN
jgi:hypothetical protein